MTILPLLESSGVLIAEDLYKKIKIPNKQNRCIILELVNAIQTCFCNKQCLSQQLNLVGR